MVKGSQQLGMVWHTQHLLLMMPERSAFARRARHACCGMGCELRSLWRCGLAHLALAGCGRSFSGLVSGGALPMEVLQRLSALWAQD